MKADNAEGAPLLLTRRALGGVAAGLVSTASARARNDPPRHILCKVLRHGDDIGRAAYAFAQDNDDLLVSLEVDIRIRLGFITMFRYLHHNQERWRDGRLIEFTARTLRNGVQDWAQARWNGSRLAVAGSATHPYLAPPHAIDTSYWNFRTVHDPLIDSQNGKLLAISIADAGAGAALQADGSKVPAREYRMSGELRVDLWYTAARALAGLQYYAHDGSILNYEKV